MSGSPIQADVHFQPNMDDIVKWRMTEQGVIITLSEESRKIISSVTSSYVGKFLDIYLGLEKMQQPIRINQAIDGPDLELVLEIPENRKRVISLLPPEKEYGLSKQ